MHTLPSMDPNKPIKCNILWLISEGKVLDIGSFYDLLSKHRNMLDGKDKYRSVERSLIQLRKEYPISKEIDKNGIAWYSMGKGFNKTLLDKFTELYKEFQGNLNYAKRSNTQMGILSDTKIEFSMPKIREENGKILVPLKIVPQNVKALKDNV